MMQLAESQTGGWVAIQDLEERLDASYYEPHALSTDRRVRNSNIGIKRLGSIFDVTKLSGFEYSEYFTSEELSKGTVPCVMSTNVGMSELDISGCIRISLETHRRLPRSQLSAGEIALSYTGHYRRAAVIPSYLGNLHLGPNVCKLTQRDNADPYFLSAYLNGSTGQTLLDRQKTLSAQPTVAMDRIRALPVPYPEPAIQRAIGNKVRKAERLREVAKESLARAKVYLDEILMPHVIPADYPMKKCKSVDEPRDGYFSSFMTIGSIGDRLIPQCYRPDVMFALNTVRKMTGVRPLGDIVSERIQQGSTPTYCEYGVKCLKTKNVDGIFISEDDVGSVTFEHVTRNPRSLISPNSLVINRQGAGSIGRCGIYLGSGPICINDSLFRICIKDDYDPAYVALFLSSWLGERQIEQGINGSTGQLTLGQDHLNHILVPFPDLNIQEDIGNEIRRCFAARVESKQLLALAKGLIESLIDGSLDDESLLYEDGEIVRWLNDNLQLESQASQT